MKIDERRWFDLYSKLIELLGEEPAATLMELLRPAYLEQLRRHAAELDETPLEARLSAIERRGDLHEHELVRLGAHALVGTESGDHDDG